MRSSRINIANFIFVAAMIIATVLVIVLVRNPATHRNLEDAEFYTRTELAFLGEQYTYTGYGSVEALVEAGSNPQEVGQALFVRAGCVGCHGIYGEGATVAGALWEIEGEDIEDFYADLRDGPAGMPAYPHGVLADTQIEMILAYLATAPQDAAAYGVTTTTTTRPPIVTTTMPPTTVPSATTTTSATGVDPPDTTTTTTVPEVTNRSLQAPRAEGIIIDGDPADWEGIPQLDMTLKATVGESAPAREAFVRVAHDGTYIYILFGVEDDFNWSSIDPRFAGAPSVMFPIEPAAGPHMGGVDPTGLPSLGLVDIWYWRLECEIGVEQGGAAGGAGTVAGGNDDACNLDDEFATEPEEVEDDDLPESENSLLGVFGHSNPVDDGPGTWYFEFRRPLQTGDPLDTQFSPGSTTQVALAYWDPDAGQSGWGRRDHVQSSDDGWIDVHLEG